MSSFRSGRSRYAACPRERRAGSRRNDLPEREDGGGGKDIKDAVESVILYKLLDMEAAKRDYKNEGKISQAIAQFRRSVFAEDFKRKAVSAAVKIDENEINDYYAKNTAKYMMQDLFNLGFDNHRAVHGRGDSVISELRKGGLPSRTWPRKEIRILLPVKGGHRGGCRGRISDNILSAIRIAKESEVLGPFDASRKARAMS